MTSVTLTLFGLGLGVLLVSTTRGGAGPRDPRAAVTALRARALKAQEDAARVAKYARDLTAQWSAERDRLAATTNYPS